MSSCNLVYRARLDYMLAVLLPRTLLARPEKGGIRTQRERGLAQVTPEVKLISDDHAYCVQRKYA